MKKSIALILALLMLLAIAGCAKSDGGTASPGNAATATPAPATEAPAETPVGDSQPEVLDHAGYIAADLDTYVQIETYVQDKQSWWDDKANLYCQSEDGAYFIYETYCSEEDYALLTPGTKIRVTGYKSEWSGETEIIDGSFEILEGSYVAEPMDVTALLGTDALAEHQNELVSFTGMTVEPSIDAEGNEAAYLYKWNGTGAQGDDLYFSASVDGATYTFTVESYLRDASTEVYKAVEALEIGQVIDMEGFLYWYEGPNPHITAVDVVKAAPARLDHAGYIAADLDSFVQIETYVQDKQSWWDDKANLYCQSEDGAYFIYETYCSEEDYALLIPGTKIRVTGYKSEWSGETEIIDGSFIILEGSYLAQPVDATALLGTDALAEHQNELVSFTGMTVEPSTDAEGNEAAYLYKWNGTGAQGDDLYFSASVNGETYTFTVESYLRDASTEVYKAVEALEIGQVINMEGFLYWYEGPNPHITAVSVVG